MAALLPPLHRARYDVLAAGYDAALRERRRGTLRAVAAMVALTLLSGWVTGADPARLVRHFPAFLSYFDRILTLDSGARVWTDPGEWFWGLRRWLGLLGDTLLIAYAGTLLGAAAGFLCSFATAANLVPNPLLRGAVKRGLEFCRTVPDIVFALIFVIAFGLGPMPGVLAIAIHTAGALGKQLSEVVENVDPKPIEGLAATGAAWPALVRFAVVPQVLPNFASYALLRFEINVRQASVMGFVGAGGIGQDLIEAIRKFYYADVSAILCLLILTVMAIDLVTERMRHRLIGGEP
ncbi:phosphonate ABC transporter, permease protein PhnE [Roseomonas sp. NAR14]|uniref:Phosphonate ABC transporter, permease protein PhnE n=1 Tax=Roseomonas acroporae TaxID=2937791 RepID=A0A9X2BXG0_9PROT|nr:phosphonate ABC transporter, permease protein PhnE [Roseomonas acroporae]MCK8787196.1 phosphonate ABC transporter, permease protein PhnE [Roseomonas acroporae]